MTILYHLFAKKFEQILLVFGSNAHSLIGNNKNQLLLTSVVVDVQVYFTVVGARDAVGDHVDKNLLHALRVTLDYLWEPVCFMNVGYS